MAESVSREPAGAERALPGDPIPDELFGNLPRATSEQFRKIRVLRAIDLAMCVVYLYVSDRFRGPGVQGAWLAFGVGLCLLAVFVGWWSVVRGQGRALERLRRGEFPNGSTRPPSVKRAQLRGLRWLLVILAAVTITGLVLNDVAAWFFLGFAVAMGHALGAVLAPVPSWLRERRFPTD